MGVGKTVVMEGGVEWYGVGLTLVFEVSHVGVWYGMVCEM